MKAAVYYGPGDLRIENWDAYAVGESDVLIRVRACGVCGTDIHLYRGSPGAVDLTPPVVLGHEMSGDVVQVGERVQSVAPGDRVTVDPNMGCGNCAYCRNGHRHLCQDPRGVGSNINGGFAESCVVPESLVYRLPPELPYEEGAMSEPLACCLHGIDRAGVIAGSTVAVIGAGAIGLLMVQLSLLQGASAVAVGEPNAMRRRVAASFGAEVFDPGSGSFSDSVRDRFPIGVDVAIECAGATEAMQQAVDVLRRGGTALLFSVPEADALLSLRAFDIFHRELSIKGSFINPATHGRAVQLISSRKVDTRPLITHRFALEELPEALRTQRSPEAIKVLVTPTES